MPPRLESASNTLGKFAPFANLSAVALIGFLLWQFVSHSFRTQDADRSMFERQIESIRSDNQEKMDRLYAIHTRTEDVQRDILKAVESNGKDLREMIEWCKKAARSGAMGAGGQPGGAGAGQ